MFWLFNKLKEIFLFSCTNINENTLDKCSDDTTDNLSQIVNFPEKKNEVYYIDYDDISDITWDGD